MIIRKLDHTSREVWRYPAEIVRAGEGWIVVEASFNREDVDLGYVVFRRGDRFVEFFYGERWYNIFAVHDRDSGGLKGWYCNICRPAVWDENVLNCEDLALDVWVEPDGRTRVLDRDEFEALPLPAAERERARQGLAALLALAGAGELPRG